MRVSLIQMEVLDGQPEQNFANIRFLVEKAALEKPDVIVLPEMWNIGYALDKLAELADKNGQKSRKFLSELARTYAVAIVAGSVATEKAGHFYNTTYVFDRRGQVINEYDKVHLFGLMAEDQYLSAGSSESYFELDRLLASSIICYDLRFPEWIRHLMSKGSQLLFVVAQWPEVRIEQWQMLLRARAVENQAFVVAVNRVGHGLNDDFSGQSMVIDPLGEIILQAPSHQEGIFTADLDLDQIQTVRGSIPVFKDRRTDLY